MTQSALHLSSAAVSAPVHLRRVKARHTELNNKIDAADRGILPLGHDAVTQMKFERLRLKQYLTVLKKGLSAENQEEGSASQKEG